MMPTQLLCAKQLVEGLLVPLVTDSLKKSFDRNLIIKLKQFEVPLAVQGQARWVMVNLISPPIMVWNRYHVEFELIDVRQDADNAPTYISTKRVLS